MSTQRVLIYLLRRDLRVADNPILNEISRLHSQSHAPFTHLLPLYVFPAQQIEVSGFLSSEAGISPYPEARSQVGGFWRCGHHRAKFVAESVWDMKEGLEKLGSGLEVRVGMLGDVVQQTLNSFKERGGGAEVTALWMTDEEGVEEKREMRQVRRTVESEGKEFKLWPDGKYFVDDRDLPFKDPGEVPDLFTTFKNSVSPLRDAPRAAAPTPKALPQLPSRIPPQAGPFRIPDTLNDIIAVLHKPLIFKPDLKNPPKHPSSGAHTAIPFTGGESTGQARIQHLLTSGSMSSYKETRNGLLGADFSTKLSAWLALGCITARQVHWYMVDFEDGRTELARGANGYGKGENRGTAAVRFELLWRDFFRLTTRKFGPRVFRAGGFMDMNDIKWDYNRETVERWLEGRTGMGMVDASQRELFLTGYTSNRARQNVASFLAKHLNIDWRIGAEWYESCLVDYDLGSNWGNWQYNAGVGNDSRDRKFNPAKQSSDYDPRADYIKAWVEELRHDQIAPEEAWQCWKIDGARKAQLGLEGNAGVERPLIRLQFAPRRGGSGGGRGRGGGGGGGSGGGGGGRAEQRGRATKRR